MKDIFLAKKSKIIKDFAVKHNFKIIDLKLKKVKLNDLQGLPT